MLSNITTKKNEIIANDSLESEQISKLRLWIIGLISSTWDGIQLIESGKPLTWVGLETIFCQCGIHPTKD